MGHAYMLFGPKTPPQSLRRRWEDIIKMDLEETEMNLRNWI